MSHHERMIANRPGPGYLDEDLAQQQGLQAGYMLFPEWNGKGTVAYDNSHNNYHSTLTNFATPATDWTGRGLDFDGSNDYLAISNAFRFAANRGTIVVLFTPLTTLTAQHANLFVQNSSNNGNQDGIFYHDTGQFRLRAAGELAYSVSFAANTTYMLAGSYGTGMALYIDGQQVATNATAGGTTSNTEQATIGAFLYSGGDIQHTHALFALALHYDRIMPPAEVAQLYLDPFALYRRPTLSVIDMFAGIAVAGGPFPHYTRRAMSGGMIPMRGAA